MLVALATLVVAMANAAATLIAAFKGLEKVEEIRHATNSLTDRLVASTAVASRAEGNLEGRAEQTAEKKADRP